jgi:hypothetical protein
MNDARLRLRNLQAALGASGMAALALLALGLLFLVFFVRPLESRNEDLAARIAGNAPSGLSSQRDAAAAQLDEFYAFFARKETATDSLATLYSIAKAVGVEVRSAEYRMRDTGTRVARYELTLPLSGSYSQVRAFVANSLQEMPTLSLDQISLRRERANDSRVQADVRLSLYLINP